LRRSRTTIHPPHLRRSTTSSPLLPSPDLNAARPAQGGEVWTGKGLVSKALDEPGLGKNLITGRLVRRREFAIGTNGDGVDPLMALMRCQEGGAWGIEVSLGLRNGHGHGHGQVFGLGQGQHQLSGSRSTSPLPVTPAIASSSSAPPMPARHSYPAVPQQPRRPTIPSARTTSYLPPSSDARTSSTPARAPPNPTTRKPTTTKKRPTPPPRHLASFDTNSRRPSTSKTSTGLPLDIPRHVYDNPDLLTKEQAERLIASPFFLDKLSEMTGHPLVPKVKREREDDQQGQAGKKAKSGKRVTTPTCYNCGRVNNHVWRHMTLDDETTVTICNGTLLLPLFVENQT
jgi:hypothetical protein